MRRVLLLSALLLAACSGTPRLFDGNSLGGWQASGEADWSIKNGEIVGSGGKDGYLSTQAEYQDFRLTLEFWVDATTNSGVYIRCKDRHNINPDTCYELNIWDEHPNQEARTGAIVFKVMPPLAQVQTVGKWNYYDILAEGGKLLVKVNGETTALMANADPAAGFISLQHWEKGTVRFRNIRLQPL